MSIPVTAVLGLGREVGTAVARRFHEEGRSVIAADASQKRLAQAREVLPDEIILSHSDLDAELGLSNVLTAAEEAFGRIDHAVIIPRIAEPDTLDAHDPEAFKASAMEGLNGAALAMRLFSERMLAQEDLPGSGIDRARQRGAITFILSMSAEQPAPGRFTEAVCQAAVLGAMRAGAMELAANRIRVNAIVALRPRAEEAEPWLQQRTPLGRAALADEIADAALYLTSPQAAIVTGATLRLDGGRSIFGGVLDSL